MDPRDPVEPREGRSSDAEIDQRVFPTDASIDAKARQIQNDAANVADETEDDVAKRAAQKILEDSEARTQQAADLDPEDDVVIRRTSKETGREVR